MVFVICSIIYFVGSVAFWFMCETEIQPWAVMETIIDKENVNEENENNQVIWKSRRISENFRLESIDLS